ncbi:MAG: hypothetical protein LBG80_06610, partial [Bacteroidales bacterium]|nr:hypothetical protein [Bacteroidales bacterium]
PARIGGSARYFVDIGIAADKGDIVAGVEDDADVRMYRVPGHYSREMYVYADYYREVFAG